MIVATSKRILRFSVAMWSNSAFVARAELAAGEHDSTISSTNGADGKTQNYNSLLLKHEIKTFILIKKHCFTATSLTPSTLVIRVQIIGKADL